MLGLSNKALTVSIFADDDDWRGLVYSNTPNFDNVAGVTYKGVEVTRVAPRLYSEQTHFYIAGRAEKQRRDRFFRGVLVFGSG